MNNARVIADLNWLSKSLK